MNIDDIRNDAENVMHDMSPEQKQQIEQIAKDKGVSLDEARAHFFKSQNSDNQSDQAPSQP